jgi:hypothetical protein
MRKLSPRFGLYPYEFMVQPISDKPLLPANFAQNLEFFELGPGHPDIDLMPARPEIKEMRFAQGSRCLAVYLRRRLVGYIWFSVQRHYEDEVRCTYELPHPESSVFDFDMYVMPDFRFGIGFAAVWHAANQFLGRMGIRSTFSRLTRFNVNSRKAHDRLGWERVGRALFLQAWKVEAMIATIAPFVALTWTDRMRIRLRLAPAGFSRD